MPLPDPSTHNKYIGAHVSAAGGVEHAPLNAQAIGARAFALFTRNQRRWDSPDLSQASIEAFGCNLKEAGIHAHHVLPHGSYLINPGSPDPEALIRSRNAMLDEVQRCRQLGLSLYNIHPGSHLGKGSIDACLKRVADSINWVLERSEDVCVVLENTAGQGNGVGHSFEQLAEILARVADPSRVGVCLDTCHAFAAGYDLRTPEACQQSFAEFERLIGFDALRGMHLNDSRVPLGGRVDRHQSLGRGHLGPALFAYLMDDRRFDDMPLVLETTDPELWPQEIAWLMSGAPASDPP